MHLDMSEEPLCVENCRASARAQNLGAHFVRAGAVDMHVNISQEPICHIKTEICRKNATPQNPGQQFVRACAVDMHVNISQEPLYTVFFGKNAAVQLDPRTRTHTLCEPGQPKCTSTFHKSM